MKVSLKRGFTVVELAVIIVIVSILVTLVVVVYSQAQRDARDTKRANDVRILGAALDKYFDQNSVYPTGCGGATCSGLPAQITMPSANIISTSTTQSQLATILGATTADARDPQNTSSQPFIGAASPVSNTTPGYVYRGGQTLASGTASYTYPLVELNEQGSARKCALSVALVNTPPIDTAAYILAYYQEATKTWQIKLGDRGKKPTIDAGATAGFCNIVS